MQAAEPGRPGDPVGVSSRPAKSPRLTGLREGSIFLAVALLAGLVFFGNLPAGTPLTQTDCWVTQTAREMQERGDWIIPSFCGSAWINKTPLPYWQLIAASNLLHHPIDAVLARAFGALSALGIVLVSYLLARFAFGLRIAVFTGLSVLASAFLLDYGRSASSDIQVSFWCYLSLACLFAAFNTRWSRLGMAGAYLAAGMGMLSKGPMPLPVVGLPAALYLLSLLVLPRWLGVEAGTFSQRFRYLFKRLHLAWGLPLFLLVWLPWVVLLLPGLADRLHENNWQAAWQDLLARWDTEFRQRATGELANIAEERYWPLWYYLGYYWPFVLFGMLPWTLSVPAALVWPFVKRNKPSDDRANGGSGDLRSEPVGFSNRQSNNSAIDHRQLATASPWPLSSVVFKERNLLFFAWLYFFAVMAFFTLSHGKEGRYITAALPPLGLLLGHHLAAIFAPGFVKSRGLIRLSCWSAIVLIPLGCLVGWILLGPPAFLVTVAGWVKLKLPNLTVQIGLDPGVQASMGILGIIFSVGFAAAAFAYLRRRVQTSFALIVLTMLGGFLFYKPTMDRYVHSRDHFGVYQFAGELGKMVTANAETPKRQKAETGEQPAIGNRQSAIENQKSEVGSQAFDLPTQNSALPFRLRVTGLPVRLLASDNRDARVVWATNLKIPRLVDQFEFLRRQGGHRTIRGDLELGVREAMKELRSPVPTLVMTEISPLAYRPKDGRPNVKDGYLMRLIAEELAGMEPPYVWLQVATSPPGAQPPVYKALIANFPPPAELNLGPVRRVTLDMLNVYHPTTLPTSKDFEDKLRLLEEQR